MDSTIFSRNILYHHLLIIQDISKFQKIQRESDSNISYKQYHQNLARNIQYFKILKSECIVLCFNATFYNMISISETNLLGVKILEEVKRDGE